MGCDWLLRRGRLGASLDRCYCGVRLHLHLHRWCRRLGRRVDALAALRAGPSTREGAGEGTRDCAPGRTRADAHVDAVAGGGTCAHAPHAQQQPTAIGVLSDARTSAAAREQPARERREPRPPCAMRSSKPFAGPPTRPLEAAAAHLSAERARREPQADGAIESVTPLNGAPSVEPPTDEHARCRVHHLLELALLGRVELHWADAL